MPEKHGENMVEQLVGLFDLTTVKGIKLVSALCIGS